MIHWILQRNLTNPKTLKRIETILQKKKISFEEITIIPFSKELPPIKNHHDFPIFYGSTTLMLTAYQHPYFRKSIFYDPSTFQMKNYVEQWKEKVLNHDGQLITLENLTTINSKPAQKWFIRPNHDGKEFSGQVDTFENLVGWSQKIISLNLPDIHRKTEIWIAPPKNIEKEWRLFVVNGKIVSASRYMLNGILKESNTDIPAKMLHFAQKQVEVYQLATIYAIDIALCENQYKVIECNCFNGTGFYHHDIEAIVEAINDFIVTP